MLLIERVGLGQRFGRRQGNRVADVRRRNGGLDRAGNNIDIARKISRQADFLASGQRGAIDIQAGTFRAKVHGGADVGVGYFDHHFLPTASRQQGKDNKRNEPQRGGMLHTMVD